MVVVTIAKLWSSLLVASRLLVPARPPGGGFLSRFEHPVRERRDIGGDAVGSDTAKIGGYRSISRPSQHAALIKASRYQWTICFCRCRMQASLLFTADCVRRSSRAVCRSCAIRNDPIAPKDKEGSPAWGSRRSTSSIVVMVHLSWPAGRVGPRAVARFPDTLLGSCLRSCCAFDRALRRWWVQR